MSITKLILMFVCLMSVSLEPKEAKVTPVFSKELADIPGKEGLMLFVEYRLAARTLYIATTHMRLFMSLRVQS